MSVPQTLARPVPPRGRKVCSLAAVPLVSPAPAEGRAGPQHRHVSHYTDLARTIRQSGLLRRRYAFYWTRIATAVASFLAIWTGFFVIGNSWFQLLLAAALALVVTQFGFRGHDSAHRQVFVSARWNEW